MSGVHIKEHSVLTRNLVESLVRLSPPFCGGGNPLDGSIVCTKILCAGSDSLTPPAVKPAR